MNAPSGTYLLAGVTIGVVVVAVVSGVFVLGPPSEQRARSLDDRRVEDLRGITRAVDLYWTRHGRLPASLDELSRESGVNIDSRDPDTAQPYDYRALSDETYELCAQFQRDLPEDLLRDAPERLQRDEPERLPRESRAPSRRVNKNFWAHGAGRQCFQPMVEEVIR